jgi:hypothetical protein
MGNILTATATIKGQRPLLWHAFGPDAIPLEKVERTGVAGHDPEEWRKTVLVLPSGQLYLHSSYLFGCIRDGAKYTSRKRGTIQPFVSATLQLTDDMVLLDRFLPDPTLRTPPPTDPTQPVYLDIRSVKNPATKARNVRYRVAICAGWELSFSIFWDKTIVSRGEMEASITDAGRFVGLGDGRSIGFGRFVLECFNVVEN